MNFTGQNKHSNNHGYSRKLKRHKSNRPLGAEEYREHELRAIRRRKTIARVSFFVLCIVAALIVIAAIIVYDGCVD